MTDQQKEELKEIHDNARRDYIPIIKKESLDHILDKIEEDINLKIKEHNSHESNNIFEYNILEIGTAIGYSTTIFVLKLKEILEKSNIKNEIKIYTIEKDVDRYNTAISNFKRFNIEKYIEVFNVDGEDFLTYRKFGKFLKENNIYFDIVFIDANKSRYLEYFKFSKDFVKKENYIFCDNILYNGWVFGEYTKKKHRTIVNNLKKFVNYLDSEKYEYKIYEDADGILELHNLDRKIYFN